MEVVAASEIDIPRIISIQFSAFEGDPYQEALFPGDDYHSAALRQAACDRYRRFWTSDPSAHWLLCRRASTDAVLGFALWNVYAHTRPDSEWKQPPQVDWCEGRQKEIATNFLTMNARLRWKLWEGRPYVLLNLLCVHQDCQRRGAGTELVMWGVRKADELGLAIHLEASAAGFGLYKKLGFRQVEVAYVKAEEWDGSYDREYICMVRDPKVKTKES